MKRVIFVLLIFLCQLSYAISPPTGSSEQYFCDGQPWTLNDIIVNTTEEGTTIIWFAINDNTSSPLPESTNLNNGTTYYAFQSKSADAISLAVTVYINTVIPAPTSNNDPLSCGNYTLADIPVFNTAGFTNILWFDATDQTIGSILDLSTPLLNGTTYYAFQGFGDCAQGLPVTVNLEEEVPAPEGESTQYFCESENTTLADLAVFNTFGFSTIFWFNDENQSIALAPSTVIENDVTYYAFQGIGGECILGLDVTTFIQDIIPAPLGETIYCIEGGTLSDLPIFNTDGFTSIFFYADASQNQPIDPFTTIIVSGTTYFAFQAVGCDCGCINFLTFTVYDIANCPNASINNNELDSFLIYSNPVKDILTINVSTLISDFEIVIHDIRGRKVYDNTFSLKENIVTIPVSNLRAKVYFVSLISENQLKTKKFIKQH